jgi:serine/threonine protein kinase/tetratricopeptide (TPR) repeat protein
MSHLHQREVAIFEAILQLPAREREAYLQQACEGDLELLERIRTLLDANSKETEFLAAASTEIISAQPSEKPGDRIGSYKLLQVIGEGGCGVVYMAEQDEPIRRRVALKIIKLGMDTKQVIARFEAERQALALMDHPNIAKVHDAGATATGRPYFVMELVRGVKITDYCDQKKLPTRQRLELFIQVCQAVQHAHQKGIIHRDLKPSNILVSVNDGVAVVKVIDFGIAKATTGERLTDKTLFTAFEQFIGTPAYMSPEQAEITNVDIDTRSDIYSLGVLLYELLTSQTPFDAKELLRVGLEEMRRTLREQEPARPSTRLSTLGAEELSTAATRRGLDAPKLVSLLQGDLDWIVMKCLEKDRTRRYETANGLAVDIQRHLGNEPVMARPPSTVYRLQKLARRNKLAVGAGALIAAALALGLGISSWSLIRERQAHQEAVGQRHKAEMKEKEANAEAVKSREVARFLEDMLGGVDASVAQGSDTKLLREILDRTAERVGKDLTNQPAVESELRATIGRVYFALSEYPQAEAMLRDAVKLRVSQPEKDVRQLAALHGDLGMTLWREGKLAAAREEVSAGVSLLRQATDNEGRRVLALLLNHLAAVLLDARGQDFDVSHADAEAALHEALDIQKTLFTNDHPETLETLDSLAAVLYREGKLERAETIAREVLAARQKALGEANPKLANSLNALGVILMNEGQVVEAESKFRDALEMRRKLFPKDNADLAQSLANLGSVLRKRGRFQEAEKHLKEALAMRRRLFPDGNLELAQNLNDLGLLLEAEGKLSGAEAAQREALGMMRKLLSESHPYTANCLGVLGRVLEQEGRWGQARELYVEASKAGGAVAARAEFNLGQRYSDGRGTTRDPVEAAKWFRVSADRGFSGSQVMLGQAYANGFGVPLDLAEAARWYRKAAEQGHKIAQYQLGRMCANGMGLATNETEAIKWYRKSADAGYNLAQIALGRAYASGRGVAQDDVEARRWYSNAVKPYLSAIEAARNSAAAGNPGSLNWFAWTFATSDNPELRDGRTAILLAGKAVAATSRTNHEILDTLAAAYAEAGQFTNAAETEKEALSLVGDEFRDDYKSHLRLYESGSAFRAAEKDDLTASDEMPERMACLFQARGTLRAQYGQWKEAIGDLRRAAELNPNEHVSLYLLAPLRVEAGDLEGYRENREATLARFGATSDPLTAQRVAQGSLLLPLDTQALQTVDKLVEIALKGDTNYPGALFQFTKALAEYRLGRFQQAAQWAKGAIDKMGSPSREAQAWSVQAMAEYGQNHLEAAGAAIAKANEIAETKLPKLASDDLGPNFHDWFIAHILLREASALIGGAGKAERVSR